MYQLEDRVRYSEVDCNRKLTLYGLINYLQDCATFHSEDVGLGIEVLQKEHRAWFVNSWQIEIERYPSFGENIIVKTWPYAFKGFLGYRNFTVENCDGQVYAKVNSLWSYMDTKNMRPTKLEVEVSEKYGMDPQLDAQWKSRKIALMPTRKEVGRLAADAVYIDTNGHMNNGKYVQIAERYLSAKEYIKGIRVEYRKSILEGDEVVILRGEQENITQIVMENQEHQVYAVVEFMR